VPGKNKMTVLLGIRYLLWYLVSIPVTWLASIRKERVILASNRGEGLSGNARYLFETWQKDGRFDVWALVSNREIYKELSGQYSHILFVFSWEAIKVSAQARFFILTHGRLDVPFCGFRKTVIQTWHGIPFKAIGFYRNNKVSEKIRNLLYKWFDYNSIDFFLSSSNYVSRLYEGVFRQKPAKFIEIGFPRNDVFLQEKKTSDHLLGTALKERVPSFKKVIVYAPTYRPYHSMYFPFADRLEKSGAFIELLQSTDSICLVKCHINQQLMLDTPFIQSGHIIDICNYKQLPDLQKILLNADILITDYSSVSIDALLLDIPCIYITSDIEEYVCATGNFCCDYDSLAAGAHVRSMVDMIAELKELIQGRDRFREERRVARDIFFTPSSRTSRERLALFMERIV
jgi:CDP-glycerol glycerophosphotransferase